MLSSAERHLNYTSRCLLEADKHGLMRGGIHPETGKVFFDSKFLAPTTVQNIRVRGALIHARKRAAELGLPFDLTADWFEAVWPPNGRCEVLPYIQLEWGGGMTDRNSSPSIDRIFPDRGYVQTNCRIISNRANTLKNNATTKEMALILADLKKHDSALTGVNEE